ncbi:MAG: hypothetical protein ACOX28_01640 [Bacilli bacterium]|jgi:hypothetical protein
MGKILKGLLVLAFGIGTFSVGVVYSDEAKEMYEDFKTRFSKPKEDTSEVEEDSLIIDTELV